MQNKDASLLNISTYTNYIVHNSLREVIELKTEIKITGKLLNKSRYAILTTQRLLLFDKRESFLNKKKPAKQYIISDHDFQVNSSKLQILTKASAILIELAFPSSTLAIHWWESIKQLKEVINQSKSIGVGLGLGNSIGMGNQSIIKNTMINKSNIFSSSVIEGFNEENNNSLFNIYQERKNSKNSKNGNSSPISSIIFNNTGVKKSNKKTVGFKEEISKEYVISKDKNSIEDYNNSLRNSLQTQRGFEEGETILNDDEDEDEDEDDTNKNDDDNEIDNKKLDSDKDKDIDSQNQSATKKEINSLETFSKEEEEKSNDQYNKHNNSLDKIITVNKKIKTENNKKEEDDLPDWNATPIISNKDESKPIQKLSKERNVITSNNSNNNKKSISSHSKSFSIENLKSCSMLSKEDNNLIKIGFINAFDSRKKKSQMPQTLIYTNRDNDEDGDGNDFENPEKQLMNNFTPYDSQLNDFDDYKPSITSKKVFMKGNNSNTNHQQNQNRGMAKTERDNLDLSPRLNTSNLKSLNDNKINSNPLFPIEYHKKTMSQYSHIPSKVIPALNIKPLLPSSTKYKPNNTNINSTNIKNIADHTTIHIFRNEDNKDKDKYDNTHNSPLTMRETNSIVFIEKIYKSPQSLSTVMKPSKFIEQLLENRYSKIMLRISLKEGSQNSTFVTKLYDFLSSILNTYNSNQSLLKCLFDKIPVLIRDRLNKSDLMLLQKSASNYSLTDRGSYNSEKNKEMKNLIQRDMRTLQMIFTNFMKEYCKAESNSDLIKKQKKFNRELDEIINELN